MDSRMANFTGTFRFEVDKPIFHQTITRKKERRERF